MDVFFRLISFGKKYSLFFYIALTSMLLEGFVALFPSWVVKISVDALNMPDQEGRIFLLPKQLKALVGSPSMSINVSELLAFIPYLIIGAYFLDGILKFTHQYFIKYVGTATVKDIRNQLHEHLQKLSLMQVTKEMSGTYVSRVTNDLLAIQQWIAQTLTTIFNESAKALFLFIWLLSINWKLTLITMVVIPAFVIPVLNIAKRIRKLSRKGQENIGDLSGFVQESLNNLKVTQACNLEEKRNQGFIEINEKLFSTLKKTMALESITSPLAGVIGACSIAFVFGYGLQNVSQGVISLGDFSSYFLTTVLLYEPLKRMSKIWSVVQQALGASERVFEILDTEPDLKDSQNARKAEGLKGNVSFENVTFIYKGGQKVFENLDLEIKSGEKVALVGPSGVGKTTLVSLIPRFFDPISGSVKIDRVDIREFTIESLRENVSLVTQEQKLFNCSIKENILFGKKDATQEEINIASKKAYVLEFVERFENGFDTIVGEGGSKLSGGQRQRVALARAFLKDAPILILDEPTSHLDNESEKYVKEAIDELEKNRTVIVIAHRLSTIENADMVITLDKDGKLSIKRKSLAS